jgi:peptide/nickel transport system substrate-binding protein
MTWASSRARTPAGPGTWRTWPAIALLVAGAAACGSPGARPASREPTTLRIGFGLAAGASAETGIRQAALSIALGKLLSIPRDGRTLPAFAESFSSSADGMLWRLRLRSGATFHSRHPATAGALLAILRAQLPDSMGPAFDDIEQMRAPTDRELEFALRRPSRFLAEALGDASIEERPELEPPSGIGPFYVARMQNDEIEMRANSTYYLGKPPIDRIVIKPYMSVRAAWAELLRGRVDMLYEVGADALSSLEASKDVNVFAFQRGYAYLLLLNMRSTAMRDAAFRRLLNTSIDRAALIKDALGGHGSPAEGPVWPGQWAYSPALPTFHLNPAAASARAPRTRFTLLFGEPSLERLALAVQRQLRALQVDVELESVPDMEARLRSGRFDAVLSDYRQGPNLVRPYLYWHSGGPLNFGRYANPRVDAALDAIRHATSDDAYAAGVAAFQRAIIDDPPAVFLVWRERARAVSARFLVPPETDVDVLNSIHLWRPAAGAGVPGQQHVADQ